MTDPATTALAASLEWYAAQLAYGQARTMTADEREAAYQRCIAAGKAWEKAMGKYGREVGDAT